MRRPRRRGGASARRGPCFQLRRILVVGDVLVWPHWLCSAQEAYPRRSSGPTPCHAEVANEATERGTAAGREWGSANEDSPSADRGSSGLGAAPPRDVGCLEAWTGSLRLNKSTGSASKRRRPALLARKRRASPWQGASKSSRNCSAHLRSSSSDLAPRRDAGILRALITEGAGGSQVEVSGP